MQLFLSKDSGRKNIVSLFSFYMFMGKGHILCAQRSLPSFFCNSIFMSSDSAASAFSKRHLNIKSSQKRLLEEFCFQGLKRDGSEKTIGKRMCKDLK